MGRRYNPMARRHSWEHPAEHHYRCRHCGIRKVNVQLAAATVSTGSTGRPSGRWIARWTTADGQTGDTRNGRFPDCPGPARKVPDAQP